MLLAVTGDTDPHAQQTEYIEETRQMSSTTNEDNSSHTIRIADRLPELSDDAVQDASKEDSVEWAQGMLNHYVSGALHDMPDYGITLQIVSGDTARCICVFDHGYCLFMLRMMIQTFEHAGLTLELDPHTVLRPYEASDDQGAEHEEPPASAEGFGIEVV